MNPDPKIGLCPPDECCNFCRREPTAHLISITRSEGRGAVMLAKICDLCIADCAEWVKLARKVKAAVKDGTPIDSA